MDIWLYISIVTAVFAVALSVIGAMKSDSGTVGVIAHLSIAAFMLGIISAFALPNYHGFSWQEIVSLTIVGVLAVITWKANVRHNDVLASKMKAKAKELIHNGKA